MYEIANWEQHFEIAQSRKSAARHRWVAIPNDHGGRGFRRIMKEKNGLEIFAVWIILVQLASRAPTRGVLADEKGIGYTLEDMELYTDVSVEAFERTMPFLTKLGWVCHHDGNALPPRYQRVATTVATTVQDPTQPYNTKQNKTEQEIVSLDSNSETAVEKAWERIPIHKQIDIGSFRIAWDKEITRTDVDPAMVCDKLEEYYKSEKGRGKFSRNPTTLINGGFWHEHKSAWGAVKECKFPLCTFEQDKIVKSFCDISPENAKIVETLLNSSMDNGRIAYKIWSKKV
jgi:hypothetical protein